MVELIFKEEVYQIVGAAMQVHTTLGCGFLEQVYQEALEIELREQSIPFVSQCQLETFYKGIRLKKTYLADFVVFDQIIVEIKAMEQLTSREEAQLINYLKVTGLPVGILINFGAEKLEWQRRVLTKETPKSLYRNN